MATSQQASPQHVSWFRELLLWYWALSFPPRGVAVRTFFLQPLLGLVAVLAGLLSVFLGFPPFPAGVIILVSGLVLIGLSYPISHVYHDEYPGSFHPRLEEYVARRVSRVPKDKFIPQYRARGYSDKGKITALNQQVRQALRVEVVRLKQSERSTSMPVGGVLVVGPRQSNKSGALWDAMAHELKGWTFIQWPHHMDHPANLAQSVGHRVVLWVDDLNDFAHPGEAASLIQFVQQRRNLGQQTLVLSSCRDEQDLQEAEYYFRPLMDQQQRVMTKETLSLVKPLQEVETAYGKLQPSQKSVLDTMYWLKSRHVLTFPYVVLQLLYPFFQQDGENTQNSSDPPNWDEAVSKLNKDDAKFVRSEQRAAAEKRLDVGSYDFKQWLTYSLFHKIERPDKVIVPVSIFYVDHATSRSDHEQDQITSLEQNPQPVVRALAVHSVAVETLILFGDMYLNSLENDRDNADELAIICYESALQQLDSKILSQQFPGAWAAAHIGKGNAELREGHAQKADTNFIQVTETPTQERIPTRLLARAWHGRGNATYATYLLTTGDERTNRLEAAADYFERAAQTLTTSDLLASRDPLWGEAKLNRANVLYEITEDAAKRYEQPADASGQHDAGTADLRTQLLAKIQNAQSAYREAQAVYPLVVAPAVWAEIQRRHGDLCLMEARCLPPPTNTMSPQPATDGAPNVPKSQTTSAELAKKARNYFVAALTVFSQTYLPVSWASTQLGLARTLLIIAPATPSQERDIYEACLETTRIVSQKIFSLAQSPLDWVDLQLLRAEAEIGRTRFGGGSTQTYYNSARSILEKASTMLGDFQRAVGSAHEERMKRQENQVKSLRKTLEQMSTDG